MGLNSFIPWIILIVLSIALFRVFGYVLQTSGTSLIGGNIPVSNVISHWSHSFEKFNMSAVDFYAELSNELNEHEMPHTTIGKTVHKEAGMLSASREYLRIKHGDIVFDVCASPFGKDFFVSWWLYESAGTMRRMFRNTKFGNFLEQRAQNRTFYQIDEEDMFRSCVHECILATIDRVTTPKGIRQLSDAEKQYKMGGV